jgi:hypothetical protein
LWVLFFKLVCCRPPLLSTLSPLFFCRITNILIVTTCKCRVSSYFLGHPHVLGYFLLAIIMVVVIFLCS